MFSKLATASMLYTSVDAFASVSHSYDEKLTCSQCIQSGNNFCINRATGWFYFINLGSSIPTHICCPPRNEDGTGGCPNDEDDD
jgi:hypothetical protein